MFIPTRMLSLIYHEWPEESRSCYEICQIRKICILLSHTHEIDPKPEGELHCISTQNECEITESPPDTCVSVDKWTLASRMTTMAFQGSARLKASRSAFSKPFASAFIPAIGTGSKGRLADSAAHSSKYQLPSIRLVKVYTRGKRLPNSKWSTKYDHARAFLPSRELSSCLFIYLGRTSHHPAFANSFQCLHIKVIGTHHFIESAGVILVNSDIADFDCGCKMLDSGSNSIDEVSLCFSSCNINAAMRGGQSR